MTGARGVLAVAVTGLLLVAGLGSPASLAQEEEGVELKVIPGGKGSVVMSVAGSQVGEPCTLPAGGVSSEGCRARFPVGTRVKLIATPDAGAFLGWSEANCRTGRTCTVRVGADTSVIARFEQVVVTLAKDAGGAVSSVPAGISCGPGCESDEMTLRQGARVTVTASPADGFQGFSGPCNDLAGTRCTFRAVFNLTVGAGFLEPPPPPVGDPGQLTVRVVKKTGGTVYASAPEGGDPIRCPPACASAGFDVYDTIRFRAVARRGYRHVGWSRSCSRVCLVSVTKATSIFARFARRR